MSVVREEIPGARGELWKVVWLAWGGKDQVLCEKLVNLWTMTKAKLGGFTTHRSQQRGWINALRMRGNPELKSYD